MINVKQQGVLFFKAEIASDAVNMLQNWISGIIAVWLILAAFLGFPPPVKTAIIVVSSSFVAVLNFWAGAKIATEKKQRAEDPASESEV